VWAVEQPKRRVFPFSPNFVGGEGEKFQPSLLCSFIVQFSGLAFVEPFCALTMAVVKLFSAFVYFAGFLSPEEGSEFH
jgi:hypothetical protein